MRLPPEPRSYLGLALVIGVAGFALGGIIGALEGSGPSDQAITALATLLAAIGGYTVGRGGDTP